MSTLTLDQVKKLVKSKKHLYNAMVRNGYYLPRFKASIINEEYLSKVRSGELYCPKYPDLKPLPCPDPPPREILLGEVLRISKQKGLNIGSSEGRLPDTQWLL